MPERAGGVYLDTSALGRVLLGEPDAEAVLNELSGFTRHVASRLMRVELRRLAQREDALADADQLIGGVALVPVTEAILEVAETVGPSSVATLDAIHLVTAIELREAGVLESVMTYDRALAGGAEAHGLGVISPR